jgi:hypothetical protein
MQGGAASTSIAALADANPRSVAPTRRTETSRRHPGTNGGGPFACRCCTVDISAAVCLASCRRWAVAAWRTVADCGRRVNLSPRTRTCGSAGGRGATTGSAGFMPATTVAKCSLWCRSSARSPRGITGPTNDGCNSAVSRRLETARRLSTCRSASSSFAT